MNLKARVGARIQELRQAKGLTQQELAARARVDPATLSRIESGGRNLTLDTLRDMLIGLGVSPQHFFAGEMFEDVPEQPSDQGTGIDSEWLRLEQAGADLRAHFPCGRFDASVDLPKMAADDVARAVLALREGLHGAELPAAGAEGERTALMSAAIADSFLAIAESYPKVNPSDIWRYLIYRAFIDPFNHPASSHRKDFSQSWRRTSGWALEQVLARHYGPFLDQHRLVITSLRSNLERAPLLELMGLMGKVIPDKVDQFILAKTRERIVPIGVIHVKASLAERRTDDIPASRIIKEAGYLSVFVTMDEKDTPSARPFNRGEYGMPGPNASAKRKDVEEDGNFSAVFSFNARTVESPPRTSSGCRILTIDFADPDDKFSRFLLGRWRVMRRNLR